MPLYAPVIKQISDKPYRISVFFRGLYLDSPLFRFSQNLIYLLYGLVIEASEWRNLVVLNRWRWSACCRSTNGTGVCLQVGL